MQDVPDKISEDTLRFLYSLFISNVPESVKEEWKNNFVRIFGELEWAHWFYLDNLLPNPKAVGVDFVSFCQQIFERFSHLVPRKTNWREQISEWRRYRGSTPTGSAIILDEDQQMVLLVQGFNNDRWAFPGGKVNQGETLSQCAIREVLEETGLDIEHRLDDQLFLDTYVGETTRCAFIVEGFPRTTRLQPSTKNEIEAITWFKINNLPKSLQDGTSMVSMKLKASSFYCIVPFVKQLRLYVERRKEGWSPREALSKVKASATQHGLGLRGVHSQPCISQPTKIMANTTSPASLLVPLGEENYVRSVNEALKRQSTNANKFPQSSASPCPSVNGKQQLNFFRFHTGPDENSIWSNATLDGDALAKHMAPAK